MLVPPICVRLTFSPRTFTRITLAMWRALRFQRRWRSWVRLSSSHMWGNEVVIIYMIRVRCVLRGPIVSHDYSAKRCEKKQSLHSVHVNAMKENEIVLLRMTYTDCRKRSASQLVQVASLTSHLSQKTMLLLFFEKFKNSFENGYKWCTGYSRFARVLDGFFTAITSRTSIKGLIHSFPKTYWHIYTFCYLIGLVCVV